MGQRHQIYVVHKVKEKYSALGAFHHQWCYGITAASNCLRLVEAIKKAKADPILDKNWCEYATQDAREIDVLVKAIYGVAPDGKISMVHNEAEPLIENDNIHPERGDNNDGAALVIIDEDLQEVRACMFTPGWVEGKHGKLCKSWKSYTPKEYLEFYYRGDDLVQALKDNAERATYLEKSARPILQAEFNKIMTAAKKGGAK
jgi:hypothetical protein